MHACWDTLKSLESWCGAVQNWLSPQLDIVIWMETCMFTAAHPEKIVFRSKTLVGGPSSGFVIGVKHAYITDLNT